LFRVDCGLAEVAELLCVEPLDPLGRLIGQELISGLENGFQPCSTFVGSVVQLKDGTQFPSF
jgi:hypothetical protein